MLRLVYDVARTKEQLREQLTTMRNSIDGPERAGWSLNVCWNLSLQPELTKAHAIGLYYPMEAEVDILYLARMLLERSASPFDPVIALPLTLKNRQMEFVRTDPSWFSVASGIAVPQALTEPWIPLARVPDDLTPVRPGDLDVLVVPGLAFDRQGNRLGYGAGYYDTYLARPDFQGYTFGCCFDDQLLREPLPHEEHDQRVMALGTASEVWRVPPQDLR